MSEEVDLKVAAEPEVVAEKVSEVEQVAEPEYSEKELMAIDSGWNPEGQDKDGNTLNADEYMARKPLFNKIHNMHKDMDSLQKKVETLTSDSRKMAAAFIKEKTDLVAQLKEKRETALDNLETDEVRKLDKQIESVSNAEQPTVSDAPAYSEREWNSAYMGFLKENSWYDDKPGIRAAADGIGREFNKANPNCAPSDLYNHVAAEINKEFGDRLETKPRATSKVGGTTRRAASTQKKTGVKLSDLSNEDQQVVSVMAKAIGKTTEEYLKTYEP